MMLDASGLNSEAQSCSKMRIVTQKEEKIMNMFSLYHETLGYEDSDDDGLSSYIFFFMMTVQFPERKSKCYQFLSQRWRKEKHLSSLFHARKLNFRVWITKTIRQYIVSNRLLTSLTFHTTITIATSHISQVLKRSKRTQSWAEQKKTLVVWGVYCERLYDLYNIYLPERSEGTH